MEDYIKNIRASARLISLPEIYIQLKTLLEDPNFTMAEVALLVGRDPAMAARFLRLVNSPIFRRVVKIETIGKAVSMLGVQQIHDLVLGASVASAFDGISAGTIDMRRFWHHSVYCAVTARQLALEHQGAQSDRMFLIGLLSDIGHLCMYQGIPDKAQEALTQAAKEERPLFMIERELLGFDFAAVGALMMMEWHLPKSLQQPVEFQISPSKAGDYTLDAALLHLTTALVQSELQEGIFNEGLFCVDAAAWRITGLTADQCVQARQIAAQQYAEVADTFL